MHSRKLLIKPESMFGDFARQRDGVTELRFVPSGMSMYPFIVGGRDVVTLHRLTSIHKHDIVAAHVAGKGYVLHRVYEIDGDMLTLMGDGNIKAKERCRVKDVVSVVTCINGMDCNTPFFKAVSGIWIGLGFIRRYILWFIRKLDWRL